MENTPENLEHIEHHTHAAHAGRFDRMVAVSMAIIAALLASVAMLSHRAHNATLRFQGEANRLEAEANILHTQAADQWGFFQAKNIRRHEYLALANLLKIMIPLAGKEKERDKQIETWEAKAREYEADAKKQVSTADDAAVDPEKKNLKDIRVEAEKLQAEAALKRKEAAELLTKSEDAHHKGDRFDMAELAVELGLVLCSLAVLTKKAPFWYSGVTAAGLGALVVATGFLI
jgi:hypothetical protein